MFGCAQRQGYTFKMAFHDWETYDQPQDFFGTQAGDVQVLDVGQRCPQAASHHQKC